VSSGEGRAEGGRGSVARTAPSNKLEKRAAANGFASLREKARESRSGLFSRREGRVGASVANMRKGRSEPTDLTPSEKERGEHRQAACSIVSAQIELLLACGSRHALAERKEALPKNVRKGCSSTTSTTRKLDEEMAFERKHQQKVHPQKTHVNDYPRKKG